MTTQTEPGREHLLLRPVPAMLLLVALAFVYNGYFLTTGFWADEYFFLNMHREDPLPYSRWLGMWSGDDYSSFGSIWWYEREAIGEFFRPLPSLIFEASMRWFGESAFPLHLFSITVHGLIAGNLYLLIRRLTARPFVALLAAIVFLSCEDHALTVGWISTFTDIVCVWFVTLSLVVYLRWLDSRRPAALVGSLLLLVPAFLSKESAVLAPLAMALMALYCPEGRDDEVPGFEWAGWKERVRRFLRNWISWVPAVALMAAYLVFYKLHGFGGMNNAMYIDPFGNPGRYLGHLVLHLPVMWLATGSPVPPSLVWMVPESLPVLAAAGVLTLGLLLAGLWSQRRRGLLVWSVVFYLLALLPQMSSDASERGLYLPAIASSIFLAHLLLAIGPIARRLGDTVKPPPRLARIVGWAVALGVLLPGAVMATAMPFVLVPDMSKLERHLATVPPLVQERDPEHVVLLNAPGAFYYFVAPEVVTYQLGRRVNLRTLSSLKAVASVERIDDRNFVVSLDRPGWLTSPFTGMVRPPETPQLGRAYPSGPFTATLKEMTPDGTDVAAVLFRMDRPLNDASVLYLSWDGKTFRPFDLMALPVGEPTVLAEADPGFGF